MRKALQMAFDARNRLATLQEGARPQGELNFDAAGLLEDETDSGGRLTDYTYDPLKRLTQIVDAENGASAPTQYGYNVHDDLTSVESPNGATTTYVYDDLGNLRKEDSPDRGMTLYGYDEAGNMTCKADGRYTGSATTCEAVSGRWVYAYDALNRVVSIDYTSTAAITPDIVFTWDTRDSSTQNGRLRQVTYNQGGITVSRKMDYDAWGNVTWSQQTVQDGSNTKTLTTAYEYDGNNQLKKITYPSGRIIDYVRATNGRISSITATFNGTTTDVVTGAQYYPFGPPSGYWFGNDLAHSIVRDTAYSPDVMRLFSWPPYQYFDNRSYDVDSAGDITAIEDLIDSNRSRDYGYDDLSRLTWDSGVTATAPTYAYDSNGNRLSRTATAGGFFDQDLTYNAGSNVAATYAIGGGTAVPVVHDGMGNVTDNGAGLLFAFDDGGRLNSIWQSSVVTGLLTLYNGMGELARTRKVTYDPCTNAEILLMMEYFSFAPDGRALHLVSENYSRTTTDWVWLDGEPVAQFQDSYDEENVYQGTAVTYLHTDHLGTPRIGTDDSQQVTWRRDTDAFGIGAATGPAVVRLRMPGQIALGLGGVDYNYFRDYLAQWGRYVESDPLGTLGGHNTYTYVSNRPTSLLDPFGLIACSIRPLSDWMSVTKELEGRRVLRYNLTGVPYPMPTGRAGIQLQLVRNLRVFSLSPDMDVEWWWARYTQGWVEIWTQEIRSRRVNIFCFEHIDNDCGGSEVRIYIDREDWQIKKGTPEFDRWKRIWELSPYERMAH